MKSSRAILAENALETCNEVYTAGFRNTALHDGLMESTGNRNKYPNPIRTLVDEAKRNIETPATDRIVAGIKADAITASLDACSDYLETDCVMDRLDISYEEAEKRTSGAIEFHDAMVDFA
ncbi:hypothetical protein QIH19_26575, partial [Klebsiella pneumoniae]|nr:hypothetical protein [Klebsiella pneumoniae]